MPTMSIELLCVGAENLHLSNSAVIGFDVSHPPQSDRSPSLWQDHMDRIGGSLVHLFDPEFKDSHQRWVYDIIVERDWSFFQFKKPARDLLSDLLPNLIDQTDSREIYFYSDSQWSNEAKICDQGMTVSSFLSNHDSNWIRMNTAIRIIG